MELRLVYGLEKDYHDHFVAIDLDLIQKVNNKVCPIAIKKAYVYYDNICRKPSRFIVKGLVPPKELFRSGGGYDLNNTLWLLCDDEVDYYWGNDERTNALEEILQKGRSHLEWLCRL